MATDPQLGHDALGVLDTAKSPPAPRGFRSSHSLPAVEPAATRDLDVRDTFSEAPTVDPPAVEPRTIPPPPALAPARPGSWKLRQHPSRDSVPVVSQTQIDNSEHVAHVIRLRRGITLGAMLWPAFAIADVLADVFVQPGVLGTLLIIRFAFWPSILLGMLVLRRNPPPSRAVTEFINVGLFSLAALSLALMCVHLEGFVSIYYAGIALVVVCRGAFVAEPLRVGLRNSGLIVAIHPAVLFLGTLFSPTLAAQLRVPEVMGQYVINTCFLCSTAVLTVVASHTIWALRRQVFEARSIGRYRLKCRLNKGGMGEIWAAHDKALNRDVAIKILRPDPRKSLRTVARFEREVRATSELTHPNTIRVFDYGVTEDGLWYYAMELLTGEDLGTLITREGSLAPDRAVRLLTQAARALAEAHASGIVHRDIKPENLFVATLGGETDFLKVLDFGIAQISEELDDERLTTTGNLACTPAYVAPERIKGQPADARSDVYSLGAVLYAALVGQPPFPTENASALLVAHLTQTPEPPSKRVTWDLPEGLEPIVMRCLEKDPDKRYTNAARLARALARVNVRAQGLREQSVYV